MNSKVSIVILNWNGWKDSIECLESLYQITYPNYDVILVDNGSEDDSIAKTKEWAKGELKVESKFFEYDSHNKPIEILEYERAKAEEGGDTQKEEQFFKLPPNKKLRIIKNEKNYGFAEGNNIGMRYTLKALNPDYIQLLNNDTVVEPNFLSELVKVAESNPEVGIVGPKIYYYDKPDKIWFAGGKINWWIGRPYHLIQEETEPNSELGHKSQINDFITGCSMLINKTILEKIGLLNKNYFTYFEDADFCERVKRKSFLLLYAPASTIWHKISSASIYHSKIYNYYLAKNRIIFMKKYGTIPQILIFYPYQIIIKSIGALIYFGIKYRNFKPSLSYIKGIIAGLKSIT